MGNQKSLVPALSIQEHSKAIQGAMAKSIEGFILVGQRVLEAKGQLPEEEFLTLFDKESPNYVGMAERQGYRFLSIAKGQKKLIQFQDELPADVTQLDAISRMTVKDIKSAIKADVMKPSMNRGDIAKWERSLEAPEVDPAQTEIEESEIQEAEVIEEKKENIVTINLMVATKAVIDGTPEKDRVGVIRGFMKKWGLSLTDLT
jgi:hypothetical protein